MRKRIVVRRRLRRSRGLRLGPWMLLCSPIPQGPKLGFGRIAATNTPRKPLPGQAVAWDGQGWVLIVAGVSFSVLRCRHVRLESTA
ncbi:hypothetical protein ACIP9H_34020 [Streptomyces sp. NPDC088732]|uniref:hypothetical protein n=1 Tax=Streptomyces sp. NPDC088732 TaxID=3365879 RepID=UPI00380085E4